MLFDITLYIALAIFCLGLIYRVVSWFWRVVGVGPKDVSLGSRVGSAIKGIFGAIFSRHIGSLIATFVVDTLLQIRILLAKTPPLVWVFHILIFIGFMGLLIMHALDDVLAELLFANYQPTLNPFMFLRNFFGLMVIVGLILALLRRFVFERQRIKSSFEDIFVIVLLFLIMISGYWLEATKITSYSVYQRMVDEYSSVFIPENERALEAYWVKHFNLVSPNDLSDVTPQMLDQVEPIHQEDCGFCHTEPSAAFISNALASATKADALAKDEIGLVNTLNIIHYLLCFIGLAYLPFGKMFHVISTPVSLLVAAGSRPEEENAGNVPTRQVIELSGCGHGGSCHLACPVRVKRAERIEGIPQFGPSVDFLETMDHKSLGSRKFAK